MEAHHGRLAGWPDEAGRPAASLSALREFAKLCYTTLMTQTHTETVKLPQPANLVGTWRRFGAAGPVYEIISSGDILPGGDCLMRVRVVETGEELDYRLSEILDDPRER